MGLSGKLETPVTTIRDIGQHEGQTVTIRGWLYNLRESGKLLFPIIIDGSGVIQGVVAKNAVPPELFDSIKGLTQESSVVVTGKVRADKRAPGGYELDVSNAQVLQRVNPDDPYPISPKEHGVDFLMERSEEHTSELQSLRHLVCRLLLEKKLQYVECFTAASAQIPWLVRQSVAEGGQAGGGGAGLGRLSSARCHHFATHFFFFLNERVTPKPPPFPHPRPFPT